MCNKKKLSKVDAEIVLWRASISRKAKRAEARSYFCKECKAYHTTSQRRGA